MKKIIMTTILCIVFVASFAVTTFAEYLGVPIEDKYDFGQSFSIDTIYSDDAWGSGTEGYISSDLRPFLATGTSDVFVRDRLTMSRFDGDNDEIVDFFLNENYTRVVDRTDNDTGLIISSKHPVNNNNLSKLYYKNSYGFIADLNHDYSSMLSLMLEYSDEYQDDSNALVPTVTVRYVDKLGYDRSVTSNVNWGDATLSNGNWYVGLSVLPSAIRQHLIDNAQTYSQNDRTLCHIKSIDYRIARESGYELIENIQVHRYAYFVSHDAPDIFENGDVLLIDSERYESIIYGKGLVDGRLDKNLLTGLIDGASSFFNTKIFGTISLGAVLVVFTALLTFKAFLKMFAGG